MKETLLNLAEKFKPTHWIEKTTGFIQQKMSKYHVHLVAGFGFLSFVTIFISNFEKDKILLSIMASLLIAIILTTVALIAGLLLYLMNDNIYTKYLNKRKKSIFKWISEHSQDKDIKDVLRKMTLLEMNGLSKETLLDSTHFNHFYQLLESNDINESTKRILASKVLSEEQVFYYLNYLEQYGFMDKTQEELVLMIKKQMAHTLSAEEQAQINRENLVLQYSETKTIPTTSNSNTIFEMKKKLSANL